MSDAPELDRLIFRLREAMLPTKRFVKLNADKSPSGESLEWQNDPWGIDDLARWSYWGVAGREGLVLVDCDIPETQDFIRKVLPPTFEGITARRRLTHFYFKVDGGQVPNMTLKIGGKGAGEVRANNHYVVAPGTEVDFTDKAGAHVKGKYEIQADRRIATVSYQTFMAAIGPLTGTESERKLTAEKIAEGVTEGERHAIGIRYAILLIGTHKLGEETALFEMQRWNQLNRPPMSEKDLVRMIRNAIRYVGRTKAPEKSEVSSGFADDSQLIEKMSKSDTFDTIVDFLKLTIKNDPRYIHNVVMAAMSAYTTDPINCGSEAPTSEGKTYGYTEVLRIFPQDDVLFMGGMSPKALIHRRAKLYDNDGNDLTVIVNKLTAELAELQSVKGKNKDDMAIAAKKQARAELFNTGKWIINLENTILVFLEAPSLETFMMLRPLMSHDSFESVYEFVDPVSLHTRKIILRGWPLVFYCKAGRGKEDIIWPEIKSRAILITPVMDPTKYRAGIELIAQRKGLPGQVADKVIGIQNIAEIKRIVELIKRKLTDTSKAIRAKGYKPDTNGFWIPFYKEIGAEFPANVGRNMRDARRFISMIHMSAAINVYARPTVEIDGVEYVIAVPADYERAKQIFFEETGSEIFTGVPSHVLKVFREVIVPLCLGKLSDKSKEAQQKLTEQELLAPAQGRDVTTRDISEASGVMAKTLRNHYLPALEEAGLLNSYPDPNDKRANIWRVKDLINDRITPKHTLFGEGCLFTPELLKERLDELKTISTEYAQTSNPSTLTPSRKPIELDELYNLYFRNAGVSGRIETTPAEPPIAENRDKETPKPDLGVNGHNPPPVTPSQPTPEPPTQPALPTPPAEPTVTPSQPSQLAIVQYIMSYPPRSGPTKAKIEADLGITRSRLEATIDDLVKRGAILDRGASIEVL